jgi:hypothetical protein
MLHGIEMDIIHMRGIIPLISDGMLPKPPLPDPPFTPQSPANRTIFSGRYFAGKASKT